MTTTLPIGFKYTAAFLAGRPQHTRFDNFSRKHPQMDRRKRAKIFAPFDALDGYSDSIDSKNVEYVERVELEEADRIELNETVINPPAELGRLTDARCGERSNR